MLRGFVFVVKTQLLEFLIWKTLVELQSLLAQSLLNHCGYLLLTKSSDWPLKFFIKSENTSFLVKEVC